MNILFDITDEIAMALVNNFNSKNCTEKPPTTKSYTNVWQATKKNIFYIALYILLCPLEY